ncbi:MAG: alpha/beta hydrolase fold domain-containing protein [Pseudomonadota bacterium]
MSFLLPILNTSLRLVEKPYLEAATDVLAVRQSFERKARLLFRSPSGSDFRKKTVGGRPSVLVTPRAVGSSKVAIFYLHGGAYLFGSPDTHRAMVARLCAEGGFQALLPSYRLAPEHLFPGALEDALSAYQAWRAEHAHVVIGGDSAGGGLALALLAEIGRLDLDAPLGAFAFSALTDMTGTAPSLRNNAETEVILPAHRMREIGNMYLGGSDPSDPRASPLFADFHGAPPVWLTVSDAEILLSDSQNLASRLTDQNVPVHLRVEHNLPHVWPIFQSYLPEARATLADLASWIRQLEERVGDS